MIEWGDGIYGAEAAARTYFGKRCGSRASESALLAGAIVNPRGVAGPADCASAAQAADDHASHGCCDAAAGRR